MTTYKISGNGFMRDDGTWIPRDGAGPAWDALQAWLDAGNSPSPEHTLNELQVIIATRIKAERDRRTQEGNGVLVAGKWFHTDGYSKQQHVGLKDSARDQVASGGKMSDPILIAGQQVPWFTMDGTSIVMTCQLAFDVVAADKVLDATLFAVAKAHLANMMKTSDPLAYDFSGGWPAAFVPAS